MKKLPLILLLLCSSALAGGRHEPPPPEPPPPSVTSSGSNHNALILGAIILTGVCIYHKCWKEKPVRDDNPSRITPDNMGGEKLRIGTEPRR